MFLTAGMFALISVCLTAVLFLAKSYSDAFYLKREENSSRIDSAFVGKREQCTTIQRSVHDLSGC